MADSVPFAAEFEPAPKAGHRRAPRAPVSLEGTVKHGGMARALCRVADLSRHGAKLIAYQEFEAGTRVWLTLPEEKPRARLAVVRWARGYEAGCEFEAPLDEATFEFLRSTIG
jgi:hypothetical protein